MEDFEFSLKDSPILLPYIRNQSPMHGCYAYSTTEAVSALFAVEYNEAPVELSVQQIIDQMPRNFHYEQKGKKRNKKHECYYGSHVDALHYAKSIGLFEDTAYPKRESSWDIDFPEPLPNEVKYKIGCVTRVRTADIDEKWQRERFENLVTAEDINRVLEHQPMAGAIRVYKSFVDFKGEFVFVGNAVTIAEVYMGRVGNEDADDKHHGHSILIIGWGRKNEVDYFHIKNQWGDEWGDKGYAKVRRDLIYRLAYPEGIFQVGDAAKKKKGKDVPSSSGTRKQKAHR
ncbi:uncharacterized protein LOC132066969 [Lycium ferocissimum]|uniref:uncharacterized protein LOC132066969 n=1 Tax=Lycium ferocissimum TaxID=112874 RepID=UPI0028165DAD|nr:uncharacterized protein LOC132066969 [Lycium ferocissimum]